MLTTQLSENQTFEDVFFVEADKPGNIPSGSSFDQSSPEWELCSGLHCPTGRSAGKLLHTHTHRQPSTDVFTSSDGKSSYTRTTTITNVLSK